MLVRPFVSALVFLAAAFVITLGVVVTFFGILRRDLLATALLLACVGAASGLLAFVFTRPWCCGASVACAANSSLLAL